MINSIITGQKTMYQVIKEAFIANPEEAKEMYGKAIDREGILKNKTLYLGNCVLKKECIKAMYDFIGFDDDIVFIEPEKNKKHNIHFTIGSIKCYFAVGEGKGARIHCNEEDMEKMHRFAELLFPAQCVHIKPNH